MKNRVHLAFGYGERAMFTHYIRRGNEIRKYSFLSEIKPTLIMMRESNDFNYGQDINVSMYHAFSVQQTLCCVRCMVCLWTATEKYIA